MEIAINKCYGGFCLSKEALDWLEEHGAEGKRGFWESGNIPRHDPLLIRCIKELGENVNADYVASQIEIVSVDTQGYYIENYDGFEKVITEHDLTQIDMAENKIETKKCCAICEQLYNKEKCPLYNVYQTAEDCGTDDFQNSAKYEVLCRKFELLEKLKNE